MFQIIDSAAEIPEIPEIPETDLLATKIKYYAE